MVFENLAAQFQSWALSLSGQWGYAGIFLVSFLGNASIIFPVPVFLVIFALGSILNPWILGVVAGVGAALGELTGYALGWGGKIELEKEHEKWLESVQKWLPRQEMFLIILVFALTPLPDDVTGILGGIMEYDLKKFLTAATIGKVILSTVIAWGGFYGKFLLGGSQNVLILSLIGLFAVVLYTIFRVVRKKL